jgi:hypothetical protein
MPVLIAAVVVLTLSAGKVPGERTLRAQDAPAASPIASPAASPGAVPGSAATYLPVAEALGPGWTLAATGVPEADPAVFLDTASALYLGPNGARAMVLVYRNLPGRVALQRSWEDVGEVFDSYRFDITGYATEREEELASQALPEGCIDARRVDGTDPLYGLPGAITQCAIDPDITAIVIVSGAVGDLTGYQAADAVATLVYEAGPTA